MPPLALLRQVARSDGDVLLAWRDRIATQLTLLAVVLLTPFALIDLAGGQYAVAAAIAVTQATLVVNLFALRRGHEMPVPFEVLALAIVGAVVTAIHLLGLRGVFWAYPGLFIVYFIVQRRLAMLLAVVLVLLATAAVWQPLGAAVAARVGATLLLTMLMLNVVLKVIGELQGALVTQATTDALTGAHNRRHFDTHVRALSAAAGSEPRNALLAIDIDHFKAINDRHGHDGGDEVLRRLVALLHSRMRRGDQLFRTGGEEFVLLLPDASREAALALAEELRERIAATPLLPGETVTVSIGVSMQLPGQPSAQWIKLGDRALYEAKRSGRNRVVLAAGD